VESIIPPVLGASASRPTRDALEGRLACGVKKVGVDADPPRLAASPISA